MKRQRFLALPWLTALLIVITATGVFSAERNPTWGWKEEEGLGSSPKPRTVPAQKAWQPKPAPEFNSRPKPESRPSAQARIGSGAVPNSQVLL